MVAQIRAMLSPNAAWRVTTGAPHLCPVCHGVYDLAQTLPNAPLAAPPAGAGRMWRYAARFPLDGSAPPVSLGEGGTPTVWVEVGGRQVACKLEYLNPTGSLKDRGSAVLLSLLRERAVTAAVEDSSGNAGESFAAYAARAGIAAGVYVPSNAAGPKRRQIEVHGATIHGIPGPRTATSEAVGRAAEEGAVYASDAYLPHGLAGYATIAFELLEDLGEAPAAVIAPGGAGESAAGAGAGLRCPPSRRPDRPRLAADRRPGAGLRPAVGLRRVRAVEPGLGRVGRDAGRGGAHPTPGARRPDPAHHPRRRRGHSPRSTRPPSSPPATPWPAAACTSSRPRPSSGTHWRPSCPSSPTPSPSS